MRGNSRKSEDEKKKKVGSLLPSFHLWTFPLQPRVLSTGLASIAPALIRLQCCCSCPLWLKNSNGFLISLSPGNFQSLVAFLNPTQRSITSPFISCQDPEWYSSLGWKFLTVSFNQSNLYPMLLSSAALCSYQAGIPTNLYHPSFSWDMFTPTLTHSTAL